MRGHRVVAGILALAVAAISERASAELFKCQLPDGKVVYTDREDACPGAETHTSTREVQIYEQTPAAVAPASRAPDGRAPQGARAAGAQAGLWREKKHNADKELKALEQKWDYLSQFITHCNRHRKILNANASGLPYEVSCKNIREEYAQVKTRMDEVRHYLDAKLEEECRRAGCLPGWVR